ncbi:hypothetical protein E2562_038556 [Oryza meyeriana var. granulata]|uniref:Uncharacterized protein n=1 Tax=Oryza meyeriana var. granulata TaxID=110450 RepID=A0A6G1F2C9_9ORYZ|nr:hypothetical protein E2562_038556 [Oryza meyeriana var. granulata]
MSAALAAYLFNRDERDRRNQVLIPCFSSDDTCVCMLPFLPMNANVGWLETGPELETECLKHGNFTPAEERVICEMYSKRGSSWPVIAVQLPGRSDLAIKNYWHKTLKKRFIQSA